MRAFSIHGSRKTVTTLHGVLAILLTVALLHNFTDATQARSRRAARTQTVSSVFSNLSSISVTDSNPSNTQPGTGSLYPSTISVSGLGTSLTSLKVKLTNVNHPFPPDFDLLLVGPGGQSFILQSDAGNTTAAVNRTYTFDDAAPTQLSNTGALPNNSSVRPANHQGNDGTNDMFPAPAPSGPYGNPGPQSSGTATLNGVFGGTNPNGEWSLYVTDDDFLDTGSINGGWSLDITAPLPINAPLSRVSDYDGDNKTDLAVVRNAGNGNANWYVNGTTSGFFAVGWGVISTDVFVPQDYDGDGKTDVAVWRQTEGTWYILQSQTSSLRVVNFGTNGDNPTVVDDYDGDGKADPAVVRNSGGLKTWYYLGSTSGFGYGQWGLSTDALAPGDYDGDGKADFAVRRSDVPTTGAATFYISGSTSGFRSVAWGNSSDLIAPGDYDGDGKTDFAVAHVYQGGTDLFWYVQLSGGGIIENARWGITGDLITQGDYDGDGKTDIAVWRPSTGFFYARLAAGGNIFSPWGQTGDYPPANSFAH
jgi:subtilisin-like proprotein convertase family protein